MCCKVIDEMHFCMNLIQGALLTEGYPQDDRCPPALAGVDQVGPAFESIKGLKVTEIQFKSLSGKCQEFFFMLTDQIFSIQCNVFSNQLWIDTYWVEAALVINY